MKAAIYLRVSTADQAKRDGEPEGLSIPAQREECLRVIAENGWELAGEFIEPGDSARTRDRPVLREMLDQVAQGEIGAVVVHKFDRFARNIYDHVVMSSMLRQQGCQLVSVREKTDDSPSGRLVEGVHALIADFYSANLAAEVRKGTIQKAKKGGTPFRAPLGYLNVGRLVDGVEIRTVDVDPERAPLVRQVFASFATGDYTLDRLLDELTRAGLTARPTPKRKALPLSRAQLSNLLRNPFYVGVVRYAGVEYPGRHEPLVGPDLFEQVQAVLTARNVSGEKTRKHHQYLKGSVFCGACGSRFCITRARGNGGTYMYFFCNGRAKGNGCTQPYVLVEDVEDAVSEYYATFQLEPGRIGEIREEIRKELKDMRERGRAEVKRAERQMAALSTQRTKLLDAYYLEALSLEMFKREQDRINADEKQATRLLEARNWAFSKIETALEDALRLAGSCQSIYRRGGPKVRRMLNQALFKRLLVDGRRVGGAELTDGFAEILASDLVKGAYERASGPHLSGVGSNKRNLAAVGSDPCRVGRRPGAGEPASVPPSGSIDEHRPRHGRQHLGDRPPTDDFKR